jgi:hypothetical protein
MTHQRSFPEANDTPPAVDAEIVPENQKAHRQ